MYFELFNDRKAFKSGKKYERSQQLMPIDKQNRLIIFATRNSV